MPASDHFRVADIPSNRLIGHRGPRWCSKLQPQLKRNHAWTAIASQTDAQLAPLGDIVGTFFLLLSAALTTARIGWFRRRLWEWKLTVAIIAIQVLGDVVNIVRGDSLRGGTGVIIAGALWLFLLKPRIRSMFA
jgi:hypothetical protein